MLDQARRIYQLRSSRPATNWYWGFRQFIEHHCPPSGKKLFSRVSTERGCLPAPTLRVPYLLLGALQDAASSLISRLKRFLFYHHITEHWIRCQSKVSCLSPWVTCMKIFLTTITRALCVCHHRQIELPCTDCAGSDYKILWRYRCDLLGTIIPRSTLKNLT